MAAWLGAWFSKGSAAAAAATAPSDDGGGDGRCSHPCDRHPTYPEAIATKINTSKDLAGTIKKPYRRHFVLVVEQSPDDWTRKPDKEGGSLALALVEALATHAPGPHNMVTLTSGPQPADDCCDIMVFPDGVLAAAVTRAEFAAFVTHFAQPTEVWTARLRPLPARVHVLVCAHKKRDKRCGVTGPILMDELHAQLATRDGGRLKDAVAVLPVSHIGGHKFAATAIVYPSATWYGRLLPCDVERLIVDHLDPLAAVPAHAPKLLADRLRGCGCDAVPAW